MLWVDALEWLVIFRAKLKVAEISMRNVTLQMNALRLLWTSVGGMWSSLLVLKDRLERFLESQG